MFVVVVCAVFALCRDVLETHDFSKVQGNKISPHCTVHKIMKMTEIVQKVGFYFKRIIKKLVLALCRDVLETHDLTFPKFRETRFRRTAQTKLSH